MTCAEYYQLNQEEGRAILKWRRFLNESGEREPELWICQLGKSYVAVDFRGPFKNKPIDEGFLVSIAGQTDIERVRLRWRRHVSLMRTERWRRRKKPKPYQKRAQAA